MYKAVEKIFRKKFNDDIHGIYIILYICIIIRIYILTNVNTLSTNFVEMRDFVHVSEVVTRMYYILLYSHYSEL